MFRTVSLKKIGALMCLGLIGLATPGWSRNAKMILPNSVSRGIGIELILILAPAISPDWLCWLIEKEEPIEESVNLLKPTDDMGIVKISL